MNSTGSDNTNVKDIKSDIEQGEDENINDEKSSFWEVSLCGSQNHCFN